MKSRRNSRDTSNWVKFVLRMPPALKDHLSDEAERRRVSLNSIIVWHLEHPDGQRRLRRETWAKLAALEPLASDESVESSELAEMINELWRTGCVP